MATKQRKLFVTVCVLAVVMLLVKVMIVDPKLGILSSSGLKTPKNIIPGDHLLQRKNYLDEKSRDRTKFDNETLPGSPPYSAKAPKGNNPYHEITERKTSIVHTEQNNRHIVFHSQNMKPDVKVHDNGNSANPALKGYRSTSHIKSQKGSIFIGGTLKGDNLGTKTTNNDGASLQAKTNGAPIAGDIKLKDVGVGVVKNWPVIQWNPQENSIRPDDVPFKVKSEFWKNHTRTVCNALGLTTDVNNLAGKFYSSYYVDPKHKVIACRIRKVASTYVLRMFSVLLRIYHGKDPNAVNGYTMLQRMEKQITMLHRLPFYDARKRVLTYFKFLVVREPFQRLLSGYKDKFYIEPSTWYFESLGKKIVKEYRTNTSDTSKMPTFKEYVTYILDPQRKVPFDGHWESYVSWCRPCEMDYDYVVKLETLGRDLKIVFDAKNLTGLVELPEPSEKTQSLHKTDLVMNEFYSTVPKEMIQQLYQFYYPDFAIFNYDIPDVIKDLMR